MKPSTKLNDVIEIARGQEREYHWVHQSKECKFDVNSKQPAGDLLFFPRKKVKMQKIKSGFWEPRSWFIEDRLNERVTKLDLTTDVSQEGITSGLRSAIVKESNGKYLRLKGVAPNTLKYQRQFIGPATKILEFELRGLCRIEEALDEQFYTAILKYTNTLASTMKPAYVEYFLVPQHKDNLPDFLRRFKSQHEELSRLEMKLIKDEIGVAKLSQFDKKTLNLRDPRYYSMVSAYEITGDTRLDEAFYELTKNKLKGDKLYERNELMTYLSYTAGVSLGMFTTLNLVWSGRLDNTNSHLGNFVIDRSKGIIQVVLSDFGAVTPFFYFETNTKLFNHLEKDIMAFRDDFFSDVTASHPTSLQYKHFPNYLRKQCFDAFTTGFAAIIKNDARSKKEVISEIIYPDKIVLPEQIIISETEFSEKLKYITE